RWSSGAAAGSEQIASPDRLASKLDAETFPESALPRTGQFQRTAVQIACDPLSIQHCLQHAGAQCAGEVRPAFTPVEAPACKASARRARRIDIDAQTTQAFRAGARDVVGIVAA